MTNRAPLVVGNSMLTAAAIVTIALLQRSRRLRPLPVWAWPLAAMAIGWSSWAVWGDMGFLAVMIVPALLARVTQLRATVVADTIGGVSVASLIASSTAQVLFVYYGLATASAPLIWINASSAALGYVIVFVTLMRRRSPRLSLSRVAGVWP